MSESSHHHHHHNSEERITMGNDQSHTTTTTNSNLRASTASRLSALAPGSSASSSSLLNNHNHNTNHDNDDNGNDQEKRTLSSRKGESLTSTSLSSSPISFNEDASALSSPLLDLEDILYKESDDEPRDEDIFDPILCHSEDCSTYWDTNAAFVIRLPEEILFQIFAFLDTSADIKVLLSVCKQWRRIADSSTQWRRVFLTSGLDKLYRISEDLSESAQYLLRKALVKGKPFSTSMLVLGLPGHGKTSFVRRFATNDFVQSPSATKFSNQSAKKVLLMRNPLSKVLEPVEIEIWDPQSPYGTVVSPEERYYRHQPAILVLYDVNDPQSNRLTVGYFDEIQRYCDCSPLILVAASKCDLLKSGDVRRVAHWTADALKSRLLQYGSSSDHEILGTLDTSAKDGTHIELAVKLLARSLWLQALRSTNADREGKRVGSNSDRNSFHYGR